MRDEAHSTIAMIYICSFMIILLNIFMKNNRVLFFSSIFFMWILAGWSYGTADYFIYSDMYNWSTNASQISNTEIGFSLLMRISYTLGFTFQQFLMIIFAVGLALIGYTIMKNSNTPNMVLAIYFIFTFIINVTQFRQFLATAIFVFSFQYLLSRDRKSDIKYIIGILLASSIHFSSIFLLLLLVPKKINIKKVIVITSIVTFMLGLLNLINSGGYIVSLLEIFNIKLLSKIIQILESSKNNYSWLLIFRWWVKIIAFFGLFYVTQYFASYKESIMKSNSSMETSKADTFNKNNSLILRCNIMMLILIPLTAVSVDIYRIQHMLVIWNYIAICSCYNLNIKNFATTKKNIYISSALLFFAFWFLRGLILSNNNINTVFYPLFNNNLFFK